MKRLFALLLCCFFAIGLLAACSSGGSDVSYKDGSYTARFKDPSSNGYIEYLKVTVADGVVSSMEYDAYHESDETQLRSEDVTYERDMEKVSGTYPRRYGPDLVNQYFEKGNIDEVTTIAGATWSSNSFVALFKALEPSMASGATEVVLVDNVPEI